MSFQSMPPPAERFAARARKARAWAWPVRLALIACVGVAIWQEPRLAPWVHDRMQDAFAYATGVLEQSTGAGKRLAGLDGDASARGSGGFTEWFVDTVMR